ncbi:hypothetical protein C8R46DRAFT_1188925 [Mycena filopes]|nr:hypothetical protein C8R46DRAFT_1188925 [Mycena filopes]
MGLVIRAYKLVFPPTIGTRLQYPPQPPPNTTLARVESQGQKIQTGDHSVYEAKLVVDRRVYPRRSLEDLARLILDDEPCRAAHGVEPKSDSQCLKPELSLKSARRLAYMTVAYENDCPLSGSSRSSCLGRRPTPFKKGRHEHPHVGVMSDHCKTLRRELRGSNWGPRGQKNAERPVQARDARGLPIPISVSGSKGKALDESNLCTTKSPQTDRVIKKRTTSGSDATPSSGATPTSAYVRPTTGLSPCVPAALRTDSGEQPRMEDMAANGDSTPGAKGGYIFEGRSKL